jgi:hypothetical protein
MLRPAQARVCLVLLAAACATVPVPPSPQTAPAGSAAPAIIVPAPSRAGPDPTPFSTAVSLDVLPPGWRPYRLGRFKKPTQYKLVRLDGTVAMRATADSSASGLQYDTVLDLHEYPLLSWYWKVPEMIPGANNSVAQVEDSPARVVVMFEGGREALPPAEQINFDLARAIGGTELPYATLMYIWENQLPAGTVITHHFTTRIKMIVAGSGSQDLNRWHEQRVNILEDYRRAFGEEPPRVKSVGIMTDSDNTGTHTTAYYGDLRFHRREGLTSSATPPSPR